MSVLLAHRQLVHNHAVEEQQHRLILVAVVIFQRCQIKIGYIPAVIGSGFPVTQRPQQFEKQYLNSPGHNPSRQKPIPLLVFSLGILWSDFRDVQLAKLASFPTPLLR